MKKKSSSIDDVLQKRTVIPTWKSPGQAIEKTKVDQVKLNKRNTLIQPWIKKLTNTFDQNPNENTANEIYEMAEMYGFTDNLPARTLKLASNIQANVKNINLKRLTSDAYGQPIFELGGKIDVHEEMARKSINYLRKQLAENPLRPLCWSELARHYLVVAEKEKSLRSMRIALNLAKHNRYLNRAATRLLVHVQDQDQALHLLRAEPNLTKDPWLLSAEIATASSIGKDSKHLKLAKSLLDSRLFDNYQLSELAAAVGTIEMNHGSSKKAKALFSSSLSSPTSNSLAQAQWAAELDSTIIIPAAAWQTPDSYEAMALAARHEKDWSRAINACAKWLSDEPYSLRPAMLGSYFAFCPGYHEIAEQFANAGLRTDSKNVTLLNNRAVARAYQGQVLEAYQDISLALEVNEGKNNAHVLATFGLIAFRSGDPVLGRSLYRQSISWFTQEHQKGSAALALLYLLREEIQIDSSMIAKSLNLAENIKKSNLVNKLPELEGMSDLIIKEANKMKDNKIVDISQRKAVTSQEVFNQQVALFTIPSNAKELITRTEDYESLFKA